MSTPSIVAIIPARMESSRYPGKPLEKILGTPMIIHCMKRSQMSKSVTDVVVATCNREIIDAVESAGGKAVMTANTHERCTDRVLEAAHKLSPRPNYIVLVQGDEPMIRPEMLDLAIAPLLKDPTLLCSNLVAPIESDEDFKSPNTIKVVLANDGRFLYLSREPIPTGRLAPATPSSRLKQVCVMGFSLQGLELFSKLSPTPLEILESIDMNRFLQHGVRVQSVYCESGTQAVDTPADLKRVEALMQKETPLAP